jgi:hypothetical protein
MTTQQHLDLAALDPRPNRQRQRGQARAVAIRHSMEDTR